MSKFLNISTDNTLGGNAASDEQVASQKAVKDYVDNHGGGGLTNYNFTHTTNSSASSSVTVTFSADTRGTRMISVTANINVTFVVNNLSDNYLWIKNNGSSTVNVTLAGVTSTAVTVSTIYTPIDGISIDAGKLCEIGIVVNSDGAFITSRSDLSVLS